MVQHTNPGPTTLVRIVGEVPGFSRMFVCFVAQAKTFTHCRDFIGMDGCHLKGPHRGILLKAVTLDENSGIPPLAVGIMDMKKRHLAVVLIASQMQS